MSFLYCMPHGLVALVTVETTLPAVRSIAIAHEVKSLKIGILSLGICAQVCVKWVKTIACGLFKSTAWRLQTKLWPICDKFFVCQNTGVGFQRPVAKIYEARCQQCYIQVTVLTSPVRSRVATVSLTGQDVFEKSMCC